MLRLVVRKPIGFYTKIMIYVTLSIFTTTVVLSSILYVNYEKIAMQLIHSSVKDDLSHISYSANVMIDSVKTQAVQIYFDSDIASLFYSNRLDADEQRTALGRLTMYHNTLPFVHSIYVYNGDTNMIYTDLGSMPEYGAQTIGLFFDQEAIGLVDRFQSYPLFRPIPRKIPEPIPGYADKQFSNVYTFLFYDTPAAKDQLKKALVLNISESWMRQIINSMDVSSDSNVSIIDRSGKLINTSNKENFLTDLSGAAYIDRIVHDPLDSDSFIGDVDGERSLVTYVTSETTGWVFLQITPYTSITAKIDKLKSTTIAVALLILLLGLLAAAFASNRIYTPFRTMRSRLSSLEGEKRKNREAMQNEFLRNHLLLGSDDTVISFQSKLETLHIPLNPMKQFALVLFVIDAYAAFCAAYRTGDRNLLKYAVANVATELFAAQFPATAVDVGGKHLALLVHVNADSDKWQPLMTETIRSVQENVAKYQKLSLSAAVSSVGDSVVDADHSFKEAAEAARYLLFAERQSIVWAKDAEERKAKEYVYPVDKEKLLLNEIQLGKGNEARQAYLEMMETVRQHSIHAFDSTIMRLAIAIGTTIEHAEREHDILIPFDISRFVADINGMDTIGEVHEAFFRIFDQMADKWNEQKSDKYHDLIQRIAAIIHRDYMDPNLSIYVISSDVNMSPVYLGRLFKGKTGKSIAAYIADVRMEKARALLQTTDLPVNGVAERTGFANGNYFFTLFKKLYGITPNEFRQLGDRQN